MTTASEMKKPTVVVETYDDVEKGATQTTRSSEEDSQSQQGGSQSQEKPSTRNVEAPKKKRSLPIRVLKFMQAQWFLITLTVLVIIASQHQVPKEHQKAKSLYVSYICVSVIFFLTGCTLKTQVLIENYSRWKIHLFVQLQSFFMTSAIMFAIVSAAASNKDFMDPGLLVGMILTGCVATTISSNVVMTGEAHGNQALTVVQSTIGNVLGPFLTPLLFKAYTSNNAWYNKVLPEEPGGYAELYKRVFKQLGLSVFIPLILGQIVTNLFPGPTKTVCSKYKVSKLGSVALLIIIWQTYDSAFSSGAIRQVPGSNIAFVVFMSITLFSLFLFISLYTAKLWLPREDIVACCYCIPAKTPAMGVPISTVLFVGLTPLLEAKLQLPLVLYQGLQIMAGTALTGPFKKWVDNGARNQS